MNTFKFTLLILLTTFLMGSSFAVGKIGLSYSSPLLLAALRFTLAGLLMVVIVIALKRPHPESKRNWIKMLIIGTFQTAGVMGCIFLSLRTITASESSILTFTNPLLVVLFGTVFLQTRYKLYQWIGVLLGLVGVSITMGTQIEFKIGILFGILSAVFWAISTLLVKKWGLFFDTWVLSAYQMFFGGLLLLLSSFILEKPVFILNGNSLFILLWLSIMSSIVQFAVWYYLLQKGDPGKTSAFLFLAPFFGVLSGWLLLGETLYPSIIVGGLFIIIGVYLVNRNFQQKNNQVKRAL
ncbi:MULTISPECIES: DMT family transporter [Peribacillus]|uniref:DMT family transporter n=1 Tax=Peribacillus TaxID=2675229 RepID=UPI001914607B|nr:MULTISPECIES: DMT family transporter [unclassified Peribacillus]MBK5445118.1 EamA family transporter [Peribacillus sp. TH24]MBK5460161.1 EamA family transporter [Peribacillus sp. TH27]MBK5481975.1 EamA family transporter [Peribacillus sp. TH16]MBK5498350.1 EamA family transporter [Peribacillus sp. TH14]WMX56535.1 DMT family transporter [Peribacillus sp. R9-11]